jgi:tetratricopeptide (TPR) repeat protein
MKLQVSTLTISLLSFYLSVSAQNFREQFNGIKDYSDTTAILKVLGNWHKAEPNDPELYVAFFNYYAKRSMTEVLSLNKTGSGGQELQLTDTKNNKTVGYLGSEISINTILLQKGFNYIDTAIEKFPNRLDMRFGEIYMLGKIPDYDKFTSKLILAIEYGEKIDLKWTWTDGKPLDDPKSFMLGSVQTYMNQLFNEGEKEGGNIKAVAQTILKYYPDDVENLSNLAVSYLFKKDYASALDPLLKAEKIAPTDYIVLNNIAYCYGAQGDKKNAIKYYELVEKYGDDNAKASAKEKLDELHKN